MDRFEWSEGGFDTGESLVLKQSGVALYDGEDKTSFMAGTLTLTTHKLLWMDHRKRSSILGLPLGLVTHLDKQASGFAKSAKIIVYLNPSPANKPAGPSQRSAYNYIRLSFRESGEREFYRCFMEELKEKRWEQTLAPPGVSPAGQGPRHRPGIVGIERSIQQKQKATDKNISKAFEDLGKLMEKAKDMVALSKTIATKIKEKQGEISEDETVRFKSYLLSMGIPDPVTKETHGTGDKYYTELAKQLSSVLEQPIQECGGMMTMSDVYCRVNRARGMELLSPEDLINACEMLEVLNLPVRLRTFDSGVMVLQLQSRQRGGNQHTLQFIRTKTYNERNTQMHDQKP
ncbi:hypothetical protein ScPMuIL_010519 [Solemya velum]